MRALCFVLSLAAATCQRVEEPAPTPAPHTEKSEQASTAAPVAAPPPRPAVASSAPLERTDAAPGAKAASSAESAVEPPDAGRCVEPLAEPPPPVAEPASICPHDPEEHPPVLRRGKIKVPEVKGAPVISVEIADTPATEQRGLMYRTKLAAEQGMIFVWPRESMRTFWMHNTCLPLDMLFVAKDGTVVGLLEQVPVLNDRPRQVRCPAAYVLEMNAGWSRRHGVKPGMKLELNL
jgi:uncharacterized membrane protein (UPF0127 family)